MGEAGEHQPPPPPQIISPVQVLMPVRGGVCPSLYTPPANLLTPIPSGQSVSLKPSVDYIRALLGSPTICITGDK